MAQTDGIIRGIVYDAETLESIIGATVGEYNQDGRLINGTSTDLDGRFTLQYRDKGNMLHVSFIGYETQIVEIGDETNIVVNLSSETIMMEEAVVTAQSTDFLTGLSSRDETGASSTTVLSEADVVGISSSAVALQGQVSGLDIVSSSGNPGSSAQLVIRGLGSLGNANPLIVVDGVPRSVSLDDIDLGSADQEDIGVLISVAPQDIRSIRVLKDAASTAVWGSRGANGVILIETNRGDKGDISYFYSYQTSLEIQPTTIPMLNGNEYITMQLEQLFNEQSVFDVPSELAYDRQFYNFNNYNKNTDWLDEITQTGMRDEHYFKVSGGGDRVLFFTSLRYLTSKGTTINTGFDQIGTRVNLNYALSNRIRFTINFDYSNSNKSDNVRLRSRNVDLVTAYQGIDDRSDNWINIRKMAYLKAPNMSVMEYDQNGELTGEYFTPLESYQGMGNEFFNPVAMANLSSDNLQRNAIQNSFKLDYSIFEWLRFSETISFQYTDSKINQFIPYSAIGVDWLNNQVNNSLEQNNVDNNFLSRTQLFLRPISDETGHFLSGVLLFEIDQSSFDRVILRSAKSSSLQFDDPAVNSPILNMRSVSGLDRKLGFMGNFNYKYKDRYLATINLRTDGSSIFGQNNRWALFPSVSMGWHIGDESWMESIQLIDEMMLRISWGQSGNTRGNSLVRYGLYDTEGQYLNRAAIEQTQIQLSNFKWETTTSWNLGMDFAFLNNRITGTFDVYDAVTDDLLWRNYEIPVSSGFDRLRFFNGGSIQNQGWELFLNSSVIQSTNLRVGLMFNISHNNNKFLSFPDNFNTERSTNVGNGDYPRVAAIGQPIGSFYGFIYEGVYATDEDAIVHDINGNVLTDINGQPIYMMYKDEIRFMGGDARYKDVNHDGRIDINDAVYLGDGNPDFTGGFGTNISWKQFRLTAQFHYRLGFDIVNEVALQTEGMNNRNNQSLAVLHRWRRQGQDEEGILPRAYMNHPANNLGSDRYVVAGDFVRLSNLSIQYTIPNRLSGRMKIDNLSINLNMRRILTFTNYDGQDPEISRVGSDPFWLGTDDAKTPVPRVYTMSVSIGF